MSFSILIVDDEVNARDFIGQFLTSKGYEVIGVASMKEAREQIARGAADIILLDVLLPDGYGPSLLEETARMLLRPPIILITAHGEIEMAVDAMKNGAHDFLTKPVQFGPLEISIKRACEIISMQRELNHYRRTQHQDLDFIVGKNPVMLEVYDQARRIAESSVSVLITGENGTGKEVLAKAIHMMGPRSQKPYMDVNCPAIQATVFESELFGHEKGAFTGADQRQHGYMELADGGILFLDEISSMQVDVQVKLLRALEERSFRRVGGSNLIRVDVQVMAASNRDLVRLMADGLFREDLYYRLKVVNLHLPPLREHREDIPELVGHFIRKYNQKMGKNVEGITPRALQALIDYHWPGNIRELRNVIERAMLFCDDPTIDIAHLSSDVTRGESGCE